MKVMLITRNEDLKELIKYPLELSGGNVIIYNNPVKAMDNYREIDPDAVLFDAADFPRHWKLGLQFLRELRTREESVYLLVTPADFCEEEIQKAAYLGVNGIISLSDNAETISESILNLIQRYKALDVLNKYKQKDFQGAALMFLNPHSLSLVKGEVVNQSDNVFLVKIHEPWLIQDISPDDLLEECSLRLDSGIINADFTARRISSGNHLLLEAASEIAKPLPGKSESVFTA